MKRFCFIVLSLCIIGNLAAQNFHWADGAGGSSSEAGNSMVTDKAGNIYVTGVFSSPSISFGSFTLNNAGSSDIFIVKYDASGNELWAKSVGGSNADEGYSLCTDDSSNIYLTGSFSSASITFGSTILANAGFFLAKCDSSGNFLWAKDASLGVGSGNSVTVDVNGYIYVTGSFTGDSISFGSDTLANTDTTGNTADFFLVKYNAAGKSIWTRGAYAPYFNDYGYGAATDNSGSVYVTGWFFSPVISFSSILLNNACNLCNPPLQTADLFLVKYTSSGNVVWAKRAGGINEDWSNSLAIDSSNNIYVTGGYQSNGIVFGSDTLANLGSYDVFIAKYNPSGSALWGKRFGGNGYDYGKSIVIDSTGNLFATGFFASSNISFGSSTLTNAGNPDIFITKFDSSCTALWAKGAGSNNFEVGNSITAGGSGDVYVTGYFSSASIMFGNFITLNNASAGSNDVFLVKLRALTDVTGILIQENVFIFPNPANGIFTIESREIKIDGIEVINVLGEKVYRLDVSNHSSTLDLSFCPAGIYFLRLDAGKGRVSRKIILNRK